MESQEIISLIGSTLSLLFLFIVGIVWLMGAKGDGKLSKEEIAPVAIIGVFIYMMVVNANRTTEFMVFDTTTVLLVLGSVIALAGIDIAKINGLLNDNRRKNSSDSK